MVCFNQVLIRLTMASGFLAINVILNNCVDSSLLGTANGLAMSITAVGRYSVASLLLYCLLI